MTAKQLIIDTLKIAGRPLACHEFHLIGISENSISARLREMRAEGKVAARFRDGKAFKEWALIEDGHFSYEHF